LYALVAGQPACFTRQAGFTATEMLVTTTVVAMTMTVAAPSLLNVIADSRLTTQINTLLGDFYLARSMAVNRNQYVTLCKSPDGRHCTTRSAWEQGWIIFLDPDKDRELAEQSDLIRVRQGLPEGMKLGFRAFGSRNYMIYTPTGFTRRNGTFTLCDHRGASSARALILYKTGRIRHASTRSDGSPLVCPG
jgi:type IV fimbrial biogenesis protein FimT